MFKTPKSKISWAEQDFISKSVNKTYSSIRTVLDKFNKISILLDCFIQTKLIYF